MFLVPLFDLKFLYEFAAGGVGTSNRRHWKRPVIGADFSFLTDLSAIFRPSFVTQRTPACERALEAPRRCHAARAA
jgi:hypothetical protein